MSQTPTNTPPMEQPLVEDPNQVTAQAHDDPGSDEEAPSRKVAKKDKGSSAGGEVARLEAQQRRSRAAEAQRKITVEAKKQSGLPTGTSTTAPRPDEGAREEIILEGQSFCTPEALKGDAFPLAVDSTGVWKKILNVLGQSKRVCLLRGGCQTGKTSLFAAGRFLNRTGQLMADKELRYVFAGTTVSSGPKEVVDGRISIEEANGRMNDGTLILVVDEAHSWFASEKSSRKGGFIVDSLKINPGRRCSILFMTTSTLEDARPQGVTPMELKDRQLWFVGPTSDRTQVEKYIKLCLTKEKIMTSEGTQDEERMGELTEEDSSGGDNTQEDEDIVKIATKSLFDMCGCNIGLVSAAIRGVQKTNSLSPFQLHDCRALMGGNGGLNPREKELVMELLALGKVKINMVAEDKDSPGKELVRKGYLVPFGLELRSELESVHDFDESSNTEFTFASALQAERLRGLLPNCMELKKDIQYKSALDFVFSLLPAMPSWCFVSSASDPESRSQLLEASLQHGASIAAASLGVQPFIEVASRPPVKTVGRPPAVDLVVKGPKFAIVEGAYAIELLSDGSINKHQDYFRKDGQHSRYNHRGQCVVLSFHTSPGDMDEKLSGVDNDIPVVAVAPHLRFGWSFYSVAYFEADGTVKRLIIPRHGIPLDRSGNPLTIYRNLESEFWVSVTLPNSTVVLRDLTDFFKSGKVSRSVSALTREVKTELADELNGIGVSKLLVYPPANPNTARTALKADDTLTTARSTNPYHVVVDSS